MAALKAFAGAMRFPIKTRMTADAGNWDCALVTPDRTLVRSLMLARTESRACTVGGWYPAAVVTPEESLTTALAALSVVSCACLSWPTWPPLFGRVATYATEA